MSCWFDIVKGDYVNWFNIVLEEDKGCFAAVFTIVNKCFQIWFMHDKIALEGWKLLEHFGIFSFGLPRCLRLLRIEILSIAAAVLSLFRNSSKAENSHG